MNRALKPALLPLLQIMSTSREDTRRNTSNEVNLTENRDIASDEAINHSFYFPGVPDSEDSLSDNEERNAMLFRCAAQEIRCD